MDLNLYSFHVVNSIKHCYKSRTVVTR